MTNWSKKLRNNIKVILWFFLITGLVVGPFILREPSGDLEKMVLTGFLTFFLIFIHLGFFFWLACQIFDFQKNKFINPSPAAKLVMFLYFMLMSVSGVKEGDELIPTIAATVLIGGIVMQIIFGFVFMVRRIRANRKTK